jgi:hypothetical protein
MLASAFLREYGDVAFKILADIEMHRWWVNRDS